LEMGGVVNGRLPVGEELFQRAGFGVCHTS
jgi:hypothetical protein